VVTICGRGGAVERSQDRLAYGRRPPAVMPAGHEGRDPASGRWLGIAPERAASRQRTTAAPAPAWSQHGQAERPGQHDQGSATAQCGCVVVRSAMSGKGMPAIPRPQGTRASANTSGPDSKLARRPPVELRSPYSRRRTERRKLVSSAGPDFDERARES
jgi:hypothetical protein